jgi:predicted regulator of Ras-like GTPase activity (Roadblock/LC7/MglB family)
MSDDLATATERLTRALAALESKTRDVKARAAVREDDLFAAPAPSGDAELRAAAVQASEALGRAAEALRDAIGQEG